MAKISETLKKDLKDKPSKYKAKKIVVDGIKFDSIAESEYYLLLKDYKQRGLIKGFSFQPKFTLQDKFTHNLMGNIRAITYKADFEVWLENWEHCIIDVKGKATNDAKNKRKMFLKRYPDMDLRWVAKSKKYGIDGWTDYFTLEKIRRDNRKKKAKQ